MPKHSMRIAPRPTANAQTLLRIPEVLAKKQEGKSTQQIADEMGLNIGQIHAIMKTRDYNELFLDTINQQIADHKARTDELWNSESTEDRREALKEEGRMIRALIPKVVHRESRSLNVDMEVKQVDIRSLLDGLSPEDQQRIIDNLSRQENTPTPVSTETGKRIIVESRESSENSVDEKPDPDE